MDETMNVPSVEPQENPVQTLDYEPAPQKSKKLPIIIGAAAAAAIAVIVLIIVLISSAAGNSYKTPVKTAEDILNTKKNFDVEDMALDLLNGYANKDVKNILKILKKSDVYTDAIEDLEEKLDDMVEMAEDEFGKNYKISLNITDTEKLDKEDWEEFEEMTNEGAQELKDEIDSMDSDDIEEMADGLEISKADTKKLVKSSKNIAKTLSKAKITAGYKLEIEVKVTGKELDDPIEKEIEINVYKIDGKWLPDPTPLVKAFSDYHDKLMFQMLQDMRDPGFDIPRPEIEEPELIPIEPEELEKLPELEMLPELYD